MQLPAQKQNGETGEWLAVLAEWPIAIEDLGIFYYEVTILGENMVKVHVGLSTRHSNIYAFGSDGDFWGHEFTTSGHPYIEGKPSFSPGDVVGCGNSPNYSHNERRAFGHCQFVCRFCFHV
uniref:SPRY domain-containing protein n=1 Tax=Globodera rostochiensis TaxID=31243 RepID=A0A914H6Z4_GLORO